MQKKVSAVTFSSDGRFALFADKFGDVGVAACGAAGVLQQQQAEGQGHQPEAPLSEQPELLLGHLCSIVTSVATSPDNRCGPQPREQPFCCGCAQPARILRRRHR